MLLQVNTLKDTTQRFIIKDAVRYGFHITFLDAQPLLLTVPLVAKLNIVGMTDFFP